MSSEISDRTKNEMVRTRIAIFYFICIIILFFRNKLGIDLEDESYHVSSVLQVLQGKVPLMSIWDGHTGFFLLAPFAAIYKALVPSLDGIVLFFREIGLSVAIIFQFINVWLFSKKYKDKDAFIFLVPACFVSPILCLSYNTASAMLLGTVCVILHTTLNDKPEKIRYLLAGILSGLVCLNYPTFSLIVVFLFVYIIIKNKKSYCVTRSMFFAGGVLFVGGAFFAWIGCSGSMDEFLAAVNGVLSGPHSDYRGPINLNFIYRTFIVGLGRFFVRGYILIIALFIATLIFIYKKYGQNKVWLYQAAFIAFCIVSVPFNRVWYGFNIFGIALFFFIMMLFVDRHFMQRYNLFFIVTILYVLIYSFTSDNKNVLLGVSACRSFISLTLFIILYEKSKQSSDLNENNFGVMSRRIILPGLIITGMLFTFGWVYGDYNFNRYTIDSYLEAGVFKGIYTTPERKDYLNNMHSFVNGTLYDYDDIEHKKLTVVTLEPMVYMMSNAEIYAPLTFDVQYLFKGFYSSEPLVNYFEFYEEYPDIIFATNYHNSDFYDNEKYEINTLIKENYELLGTKKLSDNVDAWIWEKK